MIFGGLALHRFGWLIWLHVPAVEQPNAGEFSPHYVWSPLGLTGTEPMLAVALIAVLLAVNFRPYLGWMAG